MRGGVNRLHLHSRDWCGGAEAYNRNLPDIQQLLEAGAPMSVTYEIVSEEA